MKSLTTAIFGKLAGSSLDTAIGGRLFKGRAPENTEYPYAIFLLVSNMPADTFKDKMEDILIQFSLFSSASSSSEIENMFIYLEDLYSDKDMTIAAVAPDVASTLIWMKREQVILSTEEHTTPAGTMDVWHYSVDFSIYLEKV